MFLERLRHRSRKARGGSAEFITACHQSSQMIERVVVAATAQEQHRLTFVLPGERVGRVGLNAVGIIGLRISPGTDYCQGEHYHLPNAKGSAVSTNHVSLLFFHLLSTEFPEVPIAKEGR